MPQKQLRLFGDPPIEETKKPRRRFKKMMHEKCPISTITYKLAMGGHLKDATKDEMAALSAAKHLFCIMMKTSPMLALDALGSLALEHSDLFELYAEMVRMVNGGFIPCIKNGKGKEIAGKETDPKLN